jgi:hypothetical protein
MSPSDADRRPCGFPGLTSRRGFLGQIGLAAAAAAAPASAGPAEAGPAERPEDHIPTGAMPVSLRVNGARHDLQLDSRTTLLDALREHLHLTGTVGHGVSLLRWRSGGVKHPHDTPPYPFMPSPTFAYSSHRPLL